MKLWLPGEQVTPLWLLLWLCALQIPAGSTEVGAMEKGISRGSVGPTHH